MGDNIGNFNLVDEGWIPVLWNDGRTSRVGIREAFTQAGRIRQIAAANPMDRFAILRFLLAVLYWCKGNPSEDACAELGDSFPAHWFSKLDAHKDSFNLLGNGKRFLQDSSANKRRSITNLIQEVPSGNNTWHFCHSTDGKDGFCPACCAIGLIRTPFFSVAGLAGPKEPNYKTGFNGTPPVYAIPVSNTLMKTLVCNWVSYIPLGKPHWETQELLEDTGEKIPLLNGLTMPPRRIWLAEPCDPADKCIACGKMYERLLRHCAYQASLELKSDKQWHDPHVIYQRTTPPKTTIAQDLTSTGKFKMDRPWPEISARLAEAEKHGCNSSLPLFIVGFATNQAKNVDVWERNLSMSSACTENPATSPLLFRKWQTEGNEQRKRIRNRRQPRERQMECETTIASIRPHLENTVSTRISDLVSGDVLQWEKAADEYLPVMRVIAKSLSPGFTTAALEWRRQIENAKPNMRPRTDKPEKKRRGKGEKQ